METWRFDATTGRITDAKGRDVAFIAGGPTPESMRNGTLIAAAPDLVLALQGVRREFIGLAAYLDTCSPEVIVDNLPTITANLERKRELIEAAILKAGCWV